MAFANQQIDWSATQARAETMSMKDLHYAILANQKALDSADALDRADEGNRGGFYRDEISVYRAEMGNVKNRTALSATELAGWEA